MWKFRWPGLVVAPALAGVIGALKASAGWGLIDPDTGGFIEQMAPMPLSGLRAQGNPESWNEPPFARNAVLSQPSAKLAMSSGRTRKLPWS